MLPIQSPQLIQSAHSYPQKLGNETLTSKQIVLSLLVVCQVLGDVWLSRGMRQVGGDESLHSFQLGALLSLGLHILTNPWVVLGIVFLLSSLLLYLTALSRLDLSYVLPMTASKYVLSALLAWLVLGESVSVVRWIGTGLVSGGVLLVGLSENAREPLQHHSRNQHFPALLLAPASFSLALSNVWFAIVLMVLAASTGDILLTAGMKQVGEVSSLHLRSLMRLAGRVVMNPLISLGVGCMAADFFLFIALLSRVDLSLIMPMTALSYPVSVLGSRYILKERLTTARLLGAGLIGIGVACISLNSVMV